MVSFVGIVTPPPTGSVAQLDRATAFEKELVCGRLRKS